MRYYLEPPQVTSLPPFMYKSHSVFIFTSLIKWADAEYKKALDCAVNCQDWKTVRILSKDWSGMRILSQMDGFRWICAQLDEKSWNKLDYKTRKFIRRAYELYELLRK